jgi:hypothetical protein
MDTIDPIRRLHRIAISLALTTAAITGHAQTQSPPYSAQALNPNAHRFHQAYYAMQHNTYEHGANLTDWLAAGTRAVELDIVDVGNWQADTNGPYVSHDSNVGNRNCSGNPDRIGHCLNDIMGWMDNNTGQGPVSVYVDMKPGNWTSANVRLLDDRLRQILGTRMYTSGELYQFATGIAFTNGGPNFRSAVSNNGWPLLSALSDKIIVFYTGGRLAQTNQTHAGGIEHIIANTGRLPYGFFCPDVESTPNQIIPGGTVDGVSNATSQLFVCSNLKARDHYQIAANAAHTHKQAMHLWDSHVYANDTYTFNYIAVAHGIGAIGRDGNVLHTWSGLIPLSGVRRSLPGYFELRPSYATTKCMDVNGSGTGNGTRIDLRDCNGGSNQRFVYTAEGQLRPRHVNTQCVDISGGTAGNLVNMHLWDCDGGASEKWPILDDGRFHSMSNNLQFCMSMQNGSSANGTRFVTNGCGQSQHPQFFRLNAVSDWVQTTF